VHDGVGRAAEREHRGHRVVEGASRWRCRAASGPPTPCPRCAFPVRSAICAWRESAAESRRPREA
jgi:hypothetical protein